MTTSEKLIQDAEQVIERARLAIAAIRSTSELFDQFGIHSSFDAHYGGTFFLHDAPADCKPFCRAVGGEWNKSPDGKGSFNYSSEGNFRFHIFGAEKAPSQKVEL